MEEELKERFKIAGKWIARVYMLAFVGLIVFHACDCFCDETDAKRTDLAIQHLLFRGVKSHDIKPFRGHPLMWDSGARKRLANDINRAAYKYNIDPLFLVALGFREGSLLGNRRGKLGEKGVWQMVPYVAKHIREKIEPQCTLKNNRGAALCTAAWLDHWRGKCGSLRGAFTIYITGRKCKADTPHLRWVVWDRFSLARALHNHLDKPPYTSR